MKTLLLILVSLAFAACAAPRPNVLVILSDDQRADTVGALGNSRIMTPVLDHLARSGTAFTQSYCMGGLRPAVCVTARAMLMTGRSLFEIDEEMKGQQTWPQQFGRAGYSTFACGKWHNGSESLTRSFQAGAALFLGGMGPPYSSPLHRFEGGGALARHPRPPGVHTLEIIADSAIEFLRERPQNRPFLLYVAMPAPHDPKIAPKHFHDFYNDWKPDLPANYLPLHPFDNGEMVVRDEQLVDWPRPAESIREHLADYNAFITYMDRQVGRILDALNLTGVATNTIVVFTSDQGLAIGSHGLMGKQNLYEDAIRVPLIFSGPGVPAGRTTSALAYLHDVFPTIGKLADVSAPRGSSGIDLVRAMRRNRPARPAVFTAYRRLQRAVRDEQWKLICYPEVKVAQLFDLRSDPHERNNLAGDPRHTRQVDRMFALLRREQDRAGDEMSLVGDNSRSSQWSPPIHNKTDSTWHGFRRRNFELNGRPCFLTVPGSVAEGRPWVWRASFPDFHAEVDRALLSNGWHVAYIDCVDMLGSEAALDLYDGFHEYVTTRYGLHSRPALEAVSRGGLHAYRYAARRPQRVACIYADTPVMDLKSWPFSWLGAARERKEALRAFGFDDEADLQRWRGNPVDLLAPIARARVPLRHVVSLNDQIVPPNENTFEAQRRLEKLGHSIDVVVVDKGSAESHGHHFPLPDVEETVRFIVRHSTPAE